MKIIKIFIYIIICLLSFFLFYRLAFKYFYSDTTIIDTKCFEYSRTLNGVIKVKKDNKFTVQFLDNEVIVEVDDVLYDECETGDVIRLRVYNVIDKKTNQKIGLKYEAVR